MPQRTGWHTRRSWEWRSKIKAQRRQQSETKDQVAEAMALADLETSLEYHGRNSPTGTWLYQRMEFSIETKARFPPRYPLNFRTHELYSEYNKHFFRFTMDTLVIHIYRKEGGVRGNHYIERKPSIRGSNGVRLEMGGREGWCSTFLCLGQLQNVGSQSLRSLESRISHTMRYSVSLIIQALLSLMQVDKPRFYSTLPYKDVKIYERKSSIHDFFFDFTIYDSTFNNCDLPNTNCCITYY